VPADQPVTRVVVLDGALPAPLPTARVEVRRITMAPGVAAGPHTHNGPVFGSVESGSVVFAVEDGPERVLRAGDVFHEPADVVVRRFDATAEGVVFLGYFLLGPGQESAMTPVGQSSSPPPGGSAS
jgi:quercetin dioxygenase-like cupin family protein